ncbi:hypothetical protein LLH00_00085 [bacterium]|nr:hypothetical protein [bacterium]
MRAFPALVCLALLVPAIAAAQTATGRVNVSLASGLSAAGIPAGLVCRLVREDAAVTFSLAQTAHPGVDHAVLLAAWRAATTDQQLATEAFDSQGRAAFGSLAEGRYWAVTLEPVVLGRLSLFWAEPLRVAGGRTTDLTLGLSNAALRLDSLECKLH